jgi:phosphopantothenoylcysteine decarboxylase/phosphopantothenate--cysteine ligase
VRFIGNPSTGKMGLALARAAQHRGATVTLVHGPMSAELLNLAAGDRRIAVTSAAEMHQAMLHEFPTADWIFLAAAVADVQPAVTSPHKLPKADLPPALPLVPAPDIAADLGQRKQPHQRLIGFAAQTGDIVTPAQEKLERKGLDAIAANPIDLPDSGFGSDHNQAVFLDKTGRKMAIAPCSKLQMAHQLYDFVKAME